MVEDCALPDGPEGARSRTWKGFYDPPLFAWAGVWTASAGGAGYAGFLVPGGAPAPAASTMPAIVLPEDYDARSEEHTSELQSLMRISYAVFCLKKKNTKYNNTPLKIHRSIDININTNINLHEYHETATNI